LKGKKMSQNVLHKRPHLIPAIIAAIMLFGVSGLWPCGYDDQLLRIVTCGVSLYVAYTAYNWQKIWAVWLFGFIAILFNPLTVLLGPSSLIHFSKDIWQPIEIICAVLFTVIAFILRKPVKKNAPRRLRYNVIALAIIGMLAYIFLFSSIERFVWAKTIRNGGYISMTAGREYDYIGEEWVDAAQYKRHQMGKAGQDFIAACVAVGFFCHGLGTRENEFTE
jgi:hypothetical protein